MGAFLVLFVAIIGSYAHGIYVDWASCSRGNEVRATQKDNARSAAIYLRARALHESAALAAIDLKHAQRDDSLAKRSLLDCSWPTPQVR